MWQGDILRCVYIYAKSAALERNGKPLAIVDRSSIMTNHQKQREHGIRIPCQKQHFKVYHKDDKLLRIHRYYVYKATAYNIFIDRYISYLCTFFTYIQVWWALFFAFQRYNKGALRKPMPFIRESPSLEWVGHPSSLTQVLDAMRPPNTLLVWQYPPWN